MKEELEKEEEMASNRMRMESTSYAKSEESDKGNGIGYKMDGNGTRINDESSLTRFVIRIRNLSI